MIDSITGNERKVLELLEDATGLAASLEELSSKLDMKIDSVRSLLESLHQKEFVELEIESVEILILTSEGTTYGKSGLPEIRLVKFLSSQKKGISIELARRQKGLQADTFRVALGWARRNGWVKVSKENGASQLVLTEKADDASTYPLQDILYRAVEYHGRIPESLPDELRDQLFSRSLAVVQSHPKLKRLEITRAGVEALASYQSQDGVIGDLTPETLKSGSWQGARFRSYNLSGPVRRLYPGKKHPYAEFVDRVYRALIGLGFQEAKGPLVELEFWNCDALFMPQDHVAREVHDIYHIKTPKGPGKIAYPLLLQQIAKTHEDGWTTGSSGWGYQYSEAVARRLVLRSQTTAVSVRFLAKHKEAPLRMFSIDRNFRPEKFDATHSAEFLQCEGIIGGEGLTLRDLLGYLRAIAESVGVQKIKFKPGFFPFTEPSVEGFIHMEGRGWVETLPGGIFRPEVTRPLGIDFPVLAWGIGLDRLAMAALKIDDIRELATRSLERLRNIPLR
ncbi:MAG: phenylalanine--tRNA ligase subunit alpha [Promethearchaeota archaeon]